MSDDRSRIYGTADFPDARRTPVPDEQRAEYAAAVKALRDHHGAEVIRDRDGRIAVLDAVAGSIAARALREAAAMSHGTDLTPTILGNPDPAWWYEYLRTVDETWRANLLDRADRIEKEARRG
jgi:hypothetical protein